jgi:hypothetical protein
MDIAKVYSFFLAILVVSNLILVESSFAQSISKPSVPEFIIRYVEHPFDVAPIYQIDEYLREQNTQGRLPV